MSRKVVVLLGLLTIGPLIGLVVIYFGWFSPHARARVINAEMNEIPVSEEWFELLRQLTQTVDNPEDFIRYYPPGQHCGALKLSKLVLARRLFKDHATELVPGIIHIIRTTKPYVKGDANPDYDGFRDREAAVAALPSLGRSAAPALQDLVLIVRDDVENARAAIQAIGAIGDPSSADLLISCFPRDDMDFRNKYDALLALRAVNGISGANLEKLKRGVKDTDRYVRLLSSAALAKTGDPDATVVLATLLTGYYTYDEMWCIELELEQAPLLPDRALFILSEIEQKKKLGVSEYATRVLQNRKTR